jgi:arginine-tRNA-protein transferase
MSAPNENTDRIRLFLAQPSDCGYLPKRVSRNLVCDPQFEYNKSTHTALSQQGFRRSGSFLYRPQCPNCNACIPVRVNVEHFVPGRGDRRCINANRDLKVIPRPARFSAEHYALYSQYLQARHPEGGMEDQGPEAYEQFFISDWADTVFYEFRLGRQLVGVAVTDRLDDGLSAMYSFYDHRHAKRSLGRFAILWQLQHAREQGLDWLYLGYWIDGCRKMQYKERFQPAEYFINGSWCQAWGSTAVEPNMSKSHVK